MHSNSLDSGDLQGRNGISGTISVLLHACIMYIVYCIYIYLYNIYIYNIYLYIYLLISTYEMGVLVVL